MDRSKREELEGRIRERWAERDLAGAARFAVEGYGPEVYGFLAASHRDEDDAREVWSRVTERVWAGLEGFQWQSSFRTWLYVIARNTSLRYKDEGRARAARQLPMLEDSAAPELEHRARTETASFLRTAQRERLTALRDALSEEDRTLLVLRIDKGLAWNELARVMLGGDVTPDDDMIRREAARLRKRLQLVKERLLEMKRAGEGAEGRS